MAPEMKRPQKKASVKRQRHDHDAFSTAVCELASPMAATHAANENSLGGMAATASDALEAANKKASVELLPGAAEFCT
jgi:hypothetical protein